MKKFAIVMITVLVLFVFLMLNYLLWDKENLLKQSESDRLEQNWLRGQNRTLQTTVNEQEQTIKALERENNELEDRVASLERELKQADSLSEGYKKEITRKDQVIDNYKMFTSYVLCELTLDWIESINSQDYEAVWELMDPNCLIFGRYLQQEDMVKFLGAIHSITLVEEDEEISQEEEQSEPAGFLFEILHSYGSEYDVMAIVQAKIVINEDLAKNIHGLVQGINRLRITYRLNPEEQKWTIASVIRSGV